MEKRCKREIRVSMVDGFWISISRSKCNKHYLAVVAAVEKRGGIKP